MKRRDLISSIKSLAKEHGLTVGFAEGGAHTRVKLGDRQSSIPRHAEINEITARKILEYLDPKGNKK